MAFELHPGEPLGAAVRRAVTEELTAAADGLADGGGPVARDEAVHEARKSVKRVRSLLRLVRGRIDPHRRRDANARLRAAAGGLGEVRDALVLMETAAALRADDHGDAPVTAVLDALVEALTERRAAVVLRTVSGPADGGAVRAAAALVDVRGALAALDVEDGYPADGLRWAYRGGRAGLDLPVDAEGEAFHEWRKRAKDLRYHLEFLAPVWQGPLGAHAEELHRLTDLLGHEHDLAVLVATLGREPELLPEGDRALVRSRVAARRHGQREASHTLGLVVYAEAPKRFVGRIGRYWDAAHRG